jgi:hypothetical protein
MKRIMVDFNTLNSEPVGLVKIASPEEIAEDVESALASLEQGERVILWEPGLEAEGTIQLDDGWILARPDPTTYVDTPLNEKYLQELPPALR